MGNIGKIFVVRFCFFAAVANGVDCARSFFCRREVAIWDDRNLHFGNFFGILADAFFLEKAFSIKKGSFFQRKKGVSKVLFWGVCFLSFGFFDLDISFFLVVA